MNTRSAKRMIPWILVLCLLSGCGAEPQNNQQQGYKETKSMVIDILKTEEAQKAMDEARKEHLQQSEDQVKLMQLLESPEGQQIQLAVKDILTDPSYPEFLKSYMKDPKFAGEFAKIVQAENKQIHKDLMKDPEYQTLLLDVMKEDQYEKMIIDILKSQDYRKQTMTIMQDALKNPIFRLELIELMKKAIEEEAQQSEQEKGSKEEGSSGEGGGTAGGGGGS